LGTVAILCNAVIAPLVFHEAFRLRDFTGIVLATAGAVTIVLSAKTQEEKVPPTPYKLLLSLHYSLLLSFLMLRDARRLPVFVTITKSSYHPTTSGTQ